MKHKNGNGSNRLLWVMAILVLSLVGLFTTITYAKNANGKLRELSFDWAINDHSTEDIYVKASYDTFSEREGSVGNQYNFVLVNNSKYSVWDWRITVKVDDDSQIDNTWNGVWSHGIDKLIFVPDASNRMVAKGTTKGFGLVMHSAYTFDMNEITIEYQEQRSFWSYALFNVFLAVSIICVFAIVIIELVRYRITSYAKTHAAYKDLVSESLRTIANIIDTKDEYTKGHSVRVAIYSRMIAERMGMSAYEQERIYYIGLLHDIGKVGVPVSILTKPGRLSDEEFEIIKRHPAMGATIMKDFSSIRGVTNGIKYHHERYDGKGYNEHLKGEDIPLEGRIICVADSYDAMSSRRCYRNALSYDFILDELKRNAGTQFDPDILKHMVAIVEEGYAPISDAEMEDYEI